MLRRSTQVENDVVGLELMSPAAENPPTLTEDGHYLLVGGRRWQASDPAMPEQLRTELVAELMSARRAVRTDPASARPRVQDAKVALGERGEPWWSHRPTVSGSAWRRRCARCCGTGNRRPQSVRATRPGWSVASPGGS